MKTILQPCCNTHRIIKYVDTEVWWKRGTAEGRRGEGGLKKARLWLAVAWWGALAEGPNANATLFSEVGEAGWCRPCGGGLLRCCEGVCSYIAPAGAASSVGPQLHRPNCGGPSDAWSAGGCCCPCGTAASGCYSSSCKVLAAAGSPPPTSYHGRKLGIQEKKRKG
jgi:hypothetical protein